MTIFEIKNITIVGAGTMGHSIGQQFALSGFNVNIFDQSDAVRGKVLNRIEKNLTDMAEWGLIAKNQIADAMGRLQTFSDLAEATRTADLVIEAVFEILEVKQEVFRQLDQVCPPHTILASNTSSLMPSSLAEVTNRPENVLVLHYFYPPHLMPLVEIVKSSTTDEEIAQAVYNAVVKAGKKPIITQKEALGFVANRLQMALLREAIYIIDQGIATAEDIDIAVKYGFGRRLAHVGPIELAEVQDGWFQMSQIQKYIFPDLNNENCSSPIVTEMVEKNWLGPQTGRGFYEWPQGSVENFESDLYAKLAGYIRSDQENKSSRGDR